MWKIYRWIEKDVLDEEGYIVYPAETWCLVGSYDDLSAVTNIVNQSIYLYNCLHQDDDYKNPKYKILSDFDNELGDQLDD